jgi:transcriptional regulator MraZ
MKLRGNYPAKVDEKGRLKIPASFLEELKELGNLFYITSPNGETARIYPMKVWNEIEDKLAKLPSTNKAKRKFLMRTSYFGQVVEMDGQGRVLMPSVLREKAQTKGDVAVLGALDYLEVINNARALDQMDKDPYTDEDDKVLGDLGI